MEYIITTAVGTGFAVWGTTNALGPLAAGALIGAGVFALPLLIGASMYVFGGLVFGLGFRRILAKLALFVATGGMIESREGALPN